MLSTFSSKRVFKFTFWRMFAFRLAVIILGGTSVAACSGEGDTAAGGGKSTSAAGGGGASSTSSTEGNGGGEVGGGGTGGSGGGTGGSGGGTTGSGGGTTTTGAVIGAINCLKDVCGPVAQECTDNPNCEATLACVLESGCLNKNATADSLTECAMTCVETLGLSVQETLAVVQDIAALAACGKPCGDMQQ